MADALPFGHIKAKSIEEAAAIANQRMKDTNPHLVPVEVESGDQPWCTIYMKDGNKLRIQLNVAGIYRDDTQLGPDGLPTYHVASVGSLMQAFPRKQKKK